MGYIRIFNNEKFTMGKISNFEGEMLDVVVFQPTKYCINDKVKCSYLDKTFDSKILKMSDRNLSLYVPIFLGNFENERRKVPRITTNLSALLNDHLSEKVYEFHPMISATIIDMSIKGFAFITVKELNPNVAYYLYVDLEDGYGKEERFKAKVQIQNKQQQTNDFRYGCEIVSVDKENLQLLRKFVLQYQLEQHVYETKVK